MVEDDKQQLARKIGVASLIMMASVFLSRLLGVVRESFIAYIGGAGTEVDAYNIAFALPEILNHAVAGGYLSITFIPIFAAHLEADNEQEGWRVFSIVATLFAALMLGITAVTVWLAPALVALVAPGTRGRAQVLALATRMTRIILPAQTFFFLGGLLMAVQFAKGQFFVPALAPLLYNGGIIAGGALLGGRLGIEGFAWGVLGGAALGNFALQVLGARRAGARYRPALSLSHPDLRQYVLLSLPLILGLSMTFSVEFFFRFFGSMLSDGAVASMNYALRVTMLLVGLFGSAAGTASYPFLARLHAQGRMDALLETLNQTIRRFSCLTIAASAILAILAREVVVVLFQRGAFDATATGRTTLALQILLSTAFCTATLFIVLRGFYALKNTLLPAIYGTATVVASVPVYWVAAGRFGEAGLAGAIALSSLLQALVLFTAFNRHTNNRALPSYAAIARTALAAAPPAAAAWALRRWLCTMVDSTRLFGAVAVGAAVAPVYLIGLLVAARLLGAREIDELRSRIAGKLTRRGPVTD